MRWGRAFFGVVVALSLVVSLDSLLPPSPVDANRVGKLSLFNQCIETRYESVTEFRNILYIIESCFFIFSGLIYDRKLFE